MHYLPHPTSESFLCGANAVGRRNTADGITETTCPWCLRKLDVDQDSLTSTEGVALLDAGFLLNEEDGEDQWLISHPALYERFVDNEGNPASGRPAQVRYYTREGNFCISDEDGTDFWVALPVPGEFKEAAFAVDLASLFVNLYMHDFDALANYYQS